MPHKELPDPPSGLILALEEDDDDSEKEPVDRQLDIAQDLIDAVKNGSKEQVVDALKLFKELD